MNIFIKQRTLEVAKHIIKTKQTLRQTSKVFGVSKSTVHYDVSYRLPKINQPLYEKTQKILSSNFNEKHIRGGISTKQKYEKKNQAN